MTGSALVLEVPVDAVAAAGDPAYVAGVMTAGRSALLSLAAATGLAGYVPTFDVELVGDDLPSRPTAVRFSWQRRPAEGSS